MTSSKREDQVKYQRRPADGEIVALINSSDWGMLAETKSPEGVERPSKKVYMGLSKQRKWSRNSSRNTHN